MPLKAASLVWVRLNSVPVIRSARPGIVRQFVAHLVGLECKVKSLGDLESTVLHSLNQQFATKSNDQLERAFLEFVKGLK